MAITDPNDIAGCLLWLDAGQGVYEDSGKATPATDDDDLVGAWENQSTDVSALSDVTQGTSGKKPALKLSRLNGEPAILIDGTDDYLSLSAAHTLTDFSIFIVHNCADNKFIFSSGVQALQVNPAGNILRLRDGTNISDSDPLSEAPDQFAIDEWVGDATGGTVAFYENGVAKGSGSYAGNLGLRHIPRDSLGLNAEIAEIIVYSSALSTADRNDVVAYLLEKYTPFGTPDDLQHDHTLEAPSGGLIDVVLINGQAVRVYEDPPLEIIDVIEGRSTSSFCVRDDLGLLKFLRGHRVLIYDDQAERAFAGYVDEVEEVRLNQFGALKHKVKCIDNHYRADKRRAVKSYQDEASEDIVADLVTSYLEDEDVMLADALIDPGPVIGQATFNYDATLEDCLRELATLANKWYRIDHDDVLHFRDRGSETVAWTLTGADIIGDPVLRRSQPMYRNRQYVRAQEVSDVQAFSRTGDGETREWLVGGPLAKVPTVRVNGVEKTVALKKDADSHGADYYWQKGDPVVVQDSLAAVLTGSDTIEIDYRFQVELITKSEDTAAIEERKTIEGGGSGIVEAVEAKRLAPDRASGLEYGAALLAKWGIEGEQLHWETRRNDGLAPGKVQATTLPAHGMAEEELLIASIKTTRSRSSTGFEYVRDVESIKGPNVGSWAQFLYRLTKPPAFFERLSVGEEGVVVVLNSIDETVGIDEDVTFTVATCPYPATDLYPAEDLFPC